MDTGSNITEPAVPTRPDRRKAFDAMENGILDAKMYAQILRCVIDSSGIELLEHRGRLSEDHAEQIVFLSLKLEVATRDAEISFARAF